MTTRPTDSPAFATDATFSAGAESGLAPRLDPGAGVRAQGVYPEAQVPARWFNFLRGIVGDWLLYLTEKTDGVFSPLNFDAVGDNVADDTTALQDCMDAAYAAALAGLNAGPMTVDLGGLRYRTTAALTVYPHVNVKNGAIVLDHASANVVVFSDAVSLETFANWEDVALDCAQENTGTLIVITPVVLARFARCPLNQSSNCTERLLLISAASDVIVEDITANVGSGGDGITVSNGKLTLRGGKFSAPAAFADSIVRINGGTEVRCDGVHFDLSATTSGLAACIHFTSANVEIQAYGCEFDDGNNNGNVAFRSTTLSDNQGRLTERGNKFTGTSGSVGMTPFDLSGYLLLGSSAEGLPHVNAATTDLNVDVPAYARTYSLRSTRASTTPANLQIADPVFAGQVLRLQVANDHTVAWSGFITLTNVLHQPSEADLEDLGADSSERLFLTLVAHRYEGSLDWYLEDIRKYILP